MSFRGETGGSNCQTSARSAFRTTLATEGLAFVGVALARPFGFSHAAVRTSRRGWRRVRHRIIGACVHDVGIIKRVPIVIA